MQNKTAYTAIEEMGKINMKTYGMERPYPTSAGMFEFKNQRFWEKNARGKREISCKRSELEAHAVNFIRNRCVGLRFKKDDRHINLKDSDGKSLKPNQIPYNMEMDIDRRCLEVAIHRFLESGVAKDAFDIYYVNSSIHSKEKNNTKFSITEDMSEQERYEELKDKSIVVSKPDMSKVSDIDIEAYKNLSTKEAKKPIRRIAEMLGIHNVNYKNSNIKFDFAFSKGSLDTSLNHQREYGGSYTDYAEMLTCLEKLIENAELIEVHKNYKDNEQLKRTFVLMSALSGKDGIYPVQFEVKEFYSSTKKLYLTAVLTKIKEPAVVTESHTDYSEASTPLVADSTISLSQLFANVNPTDKRLLKYVPDNFLSTE